MYMLTDHQYSRYFPKSLVSLDHWASSLNQEPTHGHRHLEAVCPRENLVFLQGRSSHNPIYPSQPSPIHGMSSEQPGLVMSLPTAEGLEPLVFTVPSKPGHSVIPWQGNMPNTVMDYLPLLKALPSLLQREMRKCVCGLVYFLFQCMKCEPKYLVTIC